MPDTPESWKHIDSYEGRYEVSDRGRVRNIITGRILKPWITDTGYLLVSLYGNGERPEKRRVHRLVAFAFLGEPGPDQEVCHGDGTRTNNAVYNLRWGTRSDNMRDAVKHGTHPNAFRGRTHCKNGHEFTPDNTLVKDDGRRCRTCRRNRVRAWRARNTTKAAA